MGYSSFNEEVAYHSKPLRRRRRLGVPLSRRSSNGRSSPTSVKSVICYDQPHRVTFQDESENQVHYVESQVSILLKETDPQDESSVQQRKQKLRQELWYQKSDVQEFRRHAATISSQWRAGNIEDTSTTTTRGLELRTSFDRQKRKQLILQRVLDVANEEWEIDPNHVAHVSREHTSYSRKVALAQAHRDYYSVYHPSLCSSLPDFDQLHCPTVLKEDDASRKRRNFYNSSSNNSDTGTTGRRVRCRMF